MNEMLLKKVITTLCAFTVLCFAHTVFAVSNSSEFNNYHEEELMTIAEDIIRWKSGITDESAMQTVLDDHLAQGAGKSEYDWFAIGISRLYPEREFPVYLKKLKERIAEEILQTDPAETVATDFQRMGLTLLALGGDPTTVDIQGEKNPVNLVATFAYDRGKQTSLGRQGITGWLWALILLDSMQYEIPEGAYNQREEIIREILSQQQVNGGFALAGNVADPDITAMVIQSLAPYYKSDQEYTYIRAEDQCSITGTVKQIVDEALDLLSRLQLDTGDYISWGNPNSQTGAQVALALCAIGIDPQEDVDFVKNGNTLIDGIMRYQLKDGGFANTLPATNSNGKASEQALNMFTALIRQMKGLRSLYDFRPEISQQESVLSSESSNVNLNENPVTPMQTGVIIGVLLLFPGLVIAGIYLIKKKRPVMFSLLLVGYVAAGLFLYNLDIQTPDDFYTDNSEVITSDSQTVYILIDCSIVSNDRSVLPSNLQSFDIVPEDGVILTETEYLLEEGDTVFDLLLKAAQYNKIQMDFNGNPDNMTGAVYIKGIHHLYEFSCGPLSGWLYKVNGEFSGSDSSKVILHDKDRVEWVYSCDLGRDIGSDIVKEGDS